ncbi:MAG: hypothetical protein WC623_24795 [Pedobacter sp.]|uniref:hypothetical protein n=1 Tax=Pedobacter sp. TaxID=1411316 RepID=UPI0035680FCC
MERKQGQDENGRFEEIIYKFIPGMGLIEVSKDDPEWKEESKKRLLLNLNRKKRNG